MSSHVEHCRRAQPGQSKPTRCKARQHRCYRGLITERSHLGHRRSSNACHHRNSSVFAGLRASGRTTECEHGLVTSLPSSAARAEGQAEASMSRHQVPAGGCSDARRRCSEHFMCQGANCRPPCPLCPSQNRSSCGRWPAACHKLLLSVVSSTSCSVCECAKSGKGSRLPSVQLHSCDSSLQQDARVIFKALGKLHQDGLAIAAPVVATDAAVGVKAPAQHVHAGLLQILAELLVATGRWQQCSACKAELVPPECEDLPPSQEAGVCLVSTADAGVLTSARSFNTRSRHASAQGCWKVPCRRT